MTKKYVPYKGIQHEVFNDAPFTGALIIAPSCSKGCKGCINQHLKDGVYKMAEPQKIIDMVKVDGLNEGVIFGGLEWSESPEALDLLARCAIKNNLKVIIYTHNTKGRFLEIPYMKQLLKDSRKSPVDFYVKYGAYMEELTVEDNFHYGVKLATSNQYIEKMNEELG